MPVPYLKDGVEHKPHPLFEERLLDIGYATFAISKDVEVVREGTITRELEAGHALSLTGSMLAHHLGLPVETIRAGASTELPQGSVRINYLGPPNALYRNDDSLSGGFVVCPSHLVVAGVYPPSFFRDKFVFIGSGLLDAPDRFRTPYFSAAYNYEKMFGVEIHAHFLRTLLSDDRLPNLSSKAALSMTFLLALLVALAVVFRHAVESAAWFSVILVGWWSCGFYQFAYGQSVLPLIIPSIGVMTSFAVAQAYLALTEGRERRHTRKLFEKYLSPEVIGEFMEDPNNWALGGRRMEITVMFADLEGFTPLSERLEPEQLVQLMNEYLTEMSAIVLKEGGTIDKYEGDLIMAFFGAPLPQEDHADRASRAAARMQSRMRELRQEWQSRGLSELRVRIGLNSGPAVVGNMGSDFRFNYTAMGDTVNLAARLESANKEFGTYTMVSHTTRMRVRSNQFSFRTLGDIAVKGKRDPVTVYELTSTAADLPDFAR